MATAKLTDNTMQQDTKTSNVISSPAQSSHSPQRIGTFRGKHFFLSNFFPSTIEYEQMKFDTVEHAFQAAKCVRDSDKIKLQKCRTPASAKSVGRRVELRPGWDEIKCEIMKTLLKIKFSENELRQQLLNTGDAELIEGNKWHDVYWGKCECAKHKLYGKNVLGNMLMDLRNELKNNK